MTANDGYAGTTAAYVAYVASGDAFRARVLTALLEGAARGHPSLPPPVAVPRDPAEPGAHSDRSGE